MIIRADSPEGLHTEIKNKNGRIATNVLVFDTENQMAELQCIITHEPDPNQNKLIGNNSIANGTFVCHMKGYKAYDKRTGQEIK